MINAQELADKLMNIPGVSVFVDGRDVLVKHPSHTCGMLRLQIDKIDLTQFDQIVEIIQGVGNAKVLSHMARIIGYFGFLHNWNRSKLGEFEARHRGNYSISEVNGASFGKSSHGTTSKEGEGCQVRDHTQISRPPLYLGNVSKEAAS